MPKRLESLTNRRCEGIVQFIRELDDAGFTNELDNGRIMRALNDKIDEIWAQMGRKGSYYITTMTRTHPVHVSELVVTLHSDLNPAVVSELILFVRKERDSIAISRDVIEDSFPPVKGDIPYTGITLEYTAAERLFKEKNRFNPATMAAFTAVYVAVSELARGEKCWLKITPLATGLDVKYIVGNKKQTNVRYEYNQ